MDDDLLTTRFEAHRGHLRAVAYRMLGSLAEADDAVQETWLRLHRSGAQGVDNLGGWLTTVTARVCLTILRSRTGRREEPLGPHLADPVVGRADGVDPEHRVLVADSVGPALLVVLDALGPAERLAFVLHDMFAMPFDEIAAILDRSPDATRQLASRARRRVRGSVPAPDPDPGRQRAVVDAFLAAARDGDFAALVAVLHPDVVLRADRGGGRTDEVRGAAAVAGRALSFQRFSAHSRPALVDGAAGAITAPDGQATAVMGFTVRDGLVVAIAVVADPARLDRIDPVVLDG